MSEVTTGLTRGLWEKAVGFLTEPNNQTTVYISSAIVVTTVAFLLFRPKGLKNNVTNGSLWKNWPVNGDSLLFIFDNKKIIDWMKNSVNKYGKTFRFSLLGRNSIWTADEAIIKQVIKQRDLFPNDLSFRHAVTYRAGRSMFSTEGDLWRQKHEILQPMMSLSSLQFNTKNIHQKMNKLLEKIGEFEENKGEEFEIELIKYLKQVTLDIIGEFAFGVDFHALDDKEDANEFTKIANGILEGINMRLIVPPFLWWFPFPTFLREKKFTRDLSILFEKIFDDYKSRRKENGGEIEGEEGKNMIEIFLSLYDQNEELAKKVYPKEEMLAECFSIWSAGHDTTTYTSGHIIKLLSENEEAQEKLREEIKQLAEKLDGEEPSYEEINKLKYLDLVVKEAQRLFPIAAFLVREANDDVIIEGVHFPKHTFVGLGIEAAQRSEEYYKDANKFIPERWLDPTTPNIFYSFGFGFRGCFGKRFALTEMKSLIYHLLLKYKIVNNSDKHPHLCESDFGYVPVDKKLVVRFQSL